ncbi:Isonitrile hydratase [Paramyrothecium foliicola]|nr:Isonitrile hydratase [Paramyrothecium foliicola]
MGLRTLLLCVLGASSGAMAVGLQPKRSVPYEPSSQETTILADSKCSDSVGEWPPSEGTSNKPGNIGLVVFPGFQILDVYGPLDAVRFASQRYPLNLYVLSDTMDPVSTAALDAATNPGISQFETTIQPTHTFKSAPDLDVILVPGGLGSRSLNIQEHIDFIANVYPSLQYVITVCTGTILAAKSGILDGKKATTNKKAWATVIQHGPKTNWIHHARWVVDGNIWTSSGVSAGIDATLAWINHVYGTVDAESIAEILEYRAHKNSSWDPFAHDANGVNDASFQVLNIPEIV